MIQKRSNGKNIKSVSKKNRLKADFSKEVSEIRKCEFCKSYMVYSQRCAVGNKCNSKYTCYRFTLRAGKEEAYKKFLLSLKNKSNRASIKK